MGASRCAFGTLLFLFVAFHVSLGAETKRLLKTEDFAAIRDVDEPNLSPDGQTVAYVVGTVDLKKDKQPKNLWLAKWDGSENRALTFGDDEQTHPRWSPDGKWLAFLSSRQDENENDQLWILSSAGGEGEQLTREKEASMTLPGRPTPNTSCLWCTTPIRVNRKRRRRKRKRFRRSSSTGSSSRRTSVVTSPTAGRTSSCSTWQAAGWMA